ncbi:Transcription factor domain-containing protein [[Candida] zeylanoides]
MTDSTGGAARKKHRADEAINRPITACQRCRTKKIKCDQGFPNCSKCAKAGATCVGLDPATGREVPRSYIMHLEERVAALESRLREAPAAPPAQDPPPGDPGSHHTLTEGIRDGTMLAGSSAPPGYLGGEGISFAKLMFAAVRVNKRLARGGAAAAAGAAASVERAGSTAAAGDEGAAGATPDSFAERPVAAEGAAGACPDSFAERPVAAEGAAGACPDSFAERPVAAEGAAGAYPDSFAERPVAGADAATAAAADAAHAAATGTAPVVDPSIYLKYDAPPANLPPKATAQEFIKIFFAQSNAQLPVLHRGEFVRNFFEPIYGALDPGVSLADDCGHAAGHAAGHATGPDAAPAAAPWFHQYKQHFARALAGGADAAAASAAIVPPQRHHRALYFLNIVFAIASSVHHLQYPNTISDSFKAAAVQYIEPVYASADQLESLQGILLLAVFSLMRPAVPGVWYVLGSALRVVADLGLHHEGAAAAAASAFTLDKRRRLFWCAYSLDRQICFYLGRPVGIPDESISVPYPSALDDEYIGAAPPDAAAPSYKLVSLAFFEIRQIQSEVQRVLLYDKSELPRRYASLEEWRAAMCARLQRWQRRVPSPAAANCAFNPEFFHLNYAHTLIVLHSLGPKRHALGEHDYREVSAASKELIRSYHLLYRSKRINYTWAAVHNLFMAGSSYLYAVYSSPQVRRANAVAEVRRVTEECLTVLASLVDRCDAAQKCRDIFEVLAAAILKVGYGETVVANAAPAAWPTTRQIARSSPAGHVNANLRSLMAGLAQPAPTAPVVAPPPQPRLADALPQPFEWITDSAAQYDLDAFFSELDNLSDAGAAAPTGAPAAAPGDATPGAAAPAGALWGDLDYTPLSASNATSAAGTLPAASPRNAKRIYELIHQMPTEAIWDQFFTSQG